MGNDDEDMIEGPTELPIDDDEDELGVEVIRDDDEDVDDAEQLGAPAPIGLVS